MIEFIDATDKNVLLVLDPDDSEENLILNLIDRFPEAIHLDAKSLTRKKKVQVDGIPPIIIISCSEKLNKSLVRHVRELSKEGSRIISLTGHRYGRFDPYSNSVGTIDVDPQHLRVFDYILVHTSDNQPI